MRKSKNNYNEAIKISSKATEEVNWWKENTLDSSESINHPVPDITIYTDSKNLGREITDRLNLSGGQWKFEELAQLIF